MKANEFVKKHGWDKVKSIVINFNYNSSNKFIVNLNNNSAISIYDLKRLIESHNLVDKVGGMDKAKLLLRMRIAAELYESADEIEKAIADVESCQ